MFHGDIFTVSAGIFKTSLQKVSLMLSCWSTMIQWWPWSFQEWCISTLLKSLQREVTLWLHLFPFSFYMPACTAFCLRVGLEVFALFVAVLPQHSSSFFSDVFCPLALYQPLFLMQPVSFSVGQSHHSDNIQLLCACDQLVNIHLSSMTDPLWAKTVCMWISHGKCWLIIDSVFSFVNAIYWRSCAQEKHTFIDTAVCQTILIDLPCFNCMFRIHRLLKHTAVPVHFLASSLPTQASFYPLVPTTMSHQTMSSCQISPVTPERVPTHIVAVSVSRHRQLLGSVTLCSLGLQGALLPGNLWSSPTRNCLQMLFMFQFFFFGLFCLFTISTTNSWV